MVGLSSVSVFASDVRLREHLGTLLHAAPGTRISVHLNFVEGPSVLGHDKLDTTMKYIKLDKATIKNNYKRYA